MPKPNIVPPPFHLTDVSDYDWKRWFNDLEVRLGNVPFSIPGAKEEDLITVVPPAELPKFDARRHGHIPTGPDDNVTPYTSLIFVYDLSPPKIAYSNGTNWLTIDDNTIIS